MANSKRKGARRKTQTKPGSGRTVKAAAKRPVKKAKAASRRKPASAPASKSSLKRKSVARPAAPKIGVAAASPARKKARAGKAARAPRATPQPIASETLVAAEPMAQTALDLDSAVSEWAHEAPTLEMEPVEPDWAEFSEPVAVTPEGHVALPPETGDTATEERSAESSSLPSLH